VPPGSIAVSPATARPGVRSRQVRPWSRAQTVAVVAVALAAVVATALAVIGRSVGASTAIWGTGADGVAPFGDATVGTTPAHGTGKVVALAGVPGGAGYWVARADGVVTAEAGAPRKGSAHGLRAPATGLAAAPDGGGYWLAAADGGVFTFGDAPFLGSAAGGALAAPIVGIAATPTGQGYWLVGADGGVFTFGDARYSGSVRSDAGLAPVTAIAGTGDGRGYWELISPRARQPLGTFVATCYTGGGTTATGTRPSQAEVAVDPGVIPLGSQVFIPGIGVRTAEDTGGAIRGERVDIWEPSYAQCIQFGAQHVAVFLLH